MSSTAASSEIDPDVATTSVTKQLGLADPDERPDSDVVIFDGNCRFCQQQVKRLNWFDGGNRLSFLSLHDPCTTERFPDFTHEQLMQQMVVIDRKGRRHGGARAVRYLSRRLPQLWWLAPLLHIPFTLPFWEWAYQKIAVRRYRLSAAIDGECTDGCDIHLKK